MSLPTLPQKILNFSTSLFVCQFQLLPKTYKNATVNAISLSSDMKCYIIYWLYDEQKEAGTEKSYSQIIEKQLSILIREG